MDRKLKDHPAADPWSAATTQPSDSHTDGPSADRLLRERLIRSEKMAILGTLVIGIAHEINNPTNYLHIGAYNLKTRFHQLQEFIHELMANTASDELRAAFGDRFKSIEDNLESVLVGIDRIKSVISDLRKFSRLDDAQKKRVKIADGLQSTVHLVEASYRDIVKFSCRFDADPELECWPAQLNQVFMNILVNGCQAIGRKVREQKGFRRGRLLVATQVVDNQLHIRFEDNGCGIQNEHISQIFEPFFTTKSEFEGTGLGLSISRDIVKRHDGEISFESKAGEGTTFMITLPVTR